MFSIRKSSVENNNNIFLNNLMNHDVQKKSEFKNTSNSKFGCFISSVKNKLDSINEMICRKKIIRSYHSVIEAIEFKLANNDISEKSLKKIERKIAEMKKNCSFLDVMNIKKEIISKIRSANEPVCEKISAMLDRKFGIYHSKEKLSSMAVPKNDFTDVRAKNKTVNADIGNTEFLKSVKNHQKILINKKERLINKDSYTLAKIVEFDAEDEDDNDIEIKYFENKMKDFLSNLNDASKFESLRELNQKLKNDMQKHKTMDAYNPIKSSFR